MPKYNERFKDCQILAKHFRIKTTVDYHINTVEHKGGAFPTYVYGSIRSGSPAASRSVRRTWIPSWCGV